MKKKIVIILISITVILMFSNVFPVYATTFEEEIKDQISNIDLSGIEEFSDEINLGENSFTVKELIFNILNNDFSLDYNSYLGYLKSFFINQFGAYLPKMLSLILIGIIFLIVKSVGGIDATIIKAIDLVLSLISGILLLSIVGGIYSEIRDLIEKISKFNEVVSPVLLTLLVASGGNVSGSLYKPIAVFVSGTVSSIVLSVCLPLSVLILILSVVSSLSSEIKIKKYVDFLSETFKWITGLLIAVFTIFLTVQGVGSSISDGISLRVTKYALTNSIPIVGNLVRQGVDVVMFGSVFIKNAIGISSIVFLLSVVIIPIIKIAVLSISLGLTSAIIGSFSDLKVSDCIFSIKKSISNFLVCLLVVWFSVFLLVLMMVVSSNVVF